MALLGQVVHEIRLWEFSLVICPSLVKAVKGKHDLSFLSVVRLPWCLAKG